LRLERKIPSAAPASRSKPHTLKLAKLPWEDPADVISIQQFFRGNGGKGTATSLRGILESWESWNFQESWNDGEESWALAAHSKPMASGTTKLCIMA